MSAFIICLLPLVLLAVIKLLDLEWVCGGPDPCGGLVLVIPVLDGQGDQGHEDADKDDNEDTTNVVDGDTTCVLLLSITILPVWVLIPPSLLHALQLSLIEKLQDPR